MALGAFDCLRCLAPVEGTAALWLVYLARHGGDADAALGTLVLAMLKTLEAQR